jgi:hypothetical protein
VCECKLVKDVFDLHSHNNTTHIIGLKQTNGDVLRFLIGGEEINNHCKNIVGPFWRAPKLLDRLQKEYKVENSGKVRNLRHVP